jgi:UDP-glucose 4-epimerase
LKKTVVLTGAGGYLGHVLLPLLEVQPWVERIIAIDLKPVASSSRTISYLMDVRDGAALRAIFAEHAATHLVHGAFVVNQPPGMSLTEMRSINVSGSMQVVRAALEHRMQHITFVSSVAVYGYRAGLPAHVSETVECKPNMVYGQHAMAVESFLSELQNRALHTRLAILRPTAFVGPKGRHYSHLRALTAQNFFVIANAGRAYTQVLHELDAADAVLRVVEHDITGVYNVAPDDQLTWAEVARLSKLPMLSLPRSLLYLLTHLQSVFPQLQGFTREMVDLFAETLVADNAALRRQTSWAPRYTSRQAFAQFFGPVGYEAKALPQV